MGVACLLVAAARRPLSPWLAAATAALEAHGDGLNCAVLRVYHGDVWKTTAGLTTGLLPDRWPAPEMAVEMLAVTVVIVVACRCLSWSSLSLLWLADTGMGDSITLLASPWESAIVAAMALKSCSRSVLSPCNGVFCSQGSLHGCTN